MTPEAQALELIERITAYIGWSGVHGTAPEPLVYPAPQPSTYPLDPRCTVVQLLATALEAARADYEEVLVDHRRLVRELDVLMNGEHAAKQASLCDIVASFEWWVKNHDKAVRAEEREACAVMCDEMSLKEGFKNISGEDDEEITRKAGAWMMMQCAAAIRARGGGG